MSRTIKFIIVILFCHFFTGLNAQRISYLEAERVAKKQLKISGSHDNRLKSGNRNKQDIQFSDAKAGKLKNDTLFYIFNVPDNMGFVIVSADKRVHPIIGYSLSGNYDENNQPPSFERWMENRKGEIAFAVENKLPPDNKIITEWENLFSSEEINTTATASVEPLIKTTWNQGCYYNELCPVDVNGSCGHVWTGCVATSTAQIMKYWNYPSSGVGEHSYYHSEYGELYADFGSANYNWEAMPANLTESNAAVATLMYHCGVAVEMDYSPDGSSAGGPLAALKNYFKYSTEAMYVWMEDYSQVDWQNLLRDELNLLRPVWYRGDGSGGHAFICDGYQDENYFHFNWGWGGYMDGYYYLGNLNPAERDYSNNQGAIIKLFPDVPVVNISVSALDSFEVVEPGSFSVSQEYKISGENLKGDLTITAPDGFSISINPSENFVQSLTLSPVFGNIGLTSVYVRFAPTQEKYYSGFINHTSLGAEVKKVEVNGIGKESPVICELDVVRGTLTRTEAAGSYTTDVLCNTTWSAISYPDWVTLDKISGEGNGQVTLSWNANTGVPRSGEVVFASCDSVQDIVYINQDGPATCELNVVRGTLTRSEWAGSYTTDVICNSTWEAVSYPDWVTLSKESGEGNGQITIYWESNSGLPRSGEVVFSACGNVPDVVYINQDGPVACELNVARGTLTRSEWAGNYTTDVICNSTWETVSYPDWVSLSKESGEGNSQVTIYWEANSGLPRSGEVVFTSCGNVQDVVYIHQDGTLACELNVVRGTLTRSEWAGSYTTDIICNSTWEAVSYPDWVTLSQESGEGDGQVTLYWEANSGLPRSGEVVFSSCGNVEDIIYINQDGTIACELNVVRGTLTRSEWAGKLYNRCHLQLYLGSSELSRLGNIKQRIGRR